ncbi:methylmalonyl-CoA mutase family protein [Streptomyces umbrinus]|uniref:methylmalonyl-CoA mutase family protein n=1 Tax=Streptomyces umbrinus TaxID=67370 RepID=UPI003C2FC7A2
MTRESEPGVPIEPVHGPDALQDRDSAEKLGEPGAYPFAHGAHSAMHVGRPWTMRQYLGFGTAVESNARYKQLIANGTMSLPLAFDLPTQMGYDSDAPIMHGQVGKVGVAIDSVDDMRVLFGGIPLDKVSTLMTINAPAAVLLLMYELVGEEQGVPASQLTGTIQNDVLKEGVARATYIFPHKTSLRLTADIIKYCKAEMPKWNTTPISGYPMAEAGGSPAQQPAANLLRVTVQGPAAVIGGTQSPHTNFFEAIALPTDKPARLTLHTQQVFAYETDVTATIDPLAGSHVIEKMTDGVEVAVTELAAKAEEELYEPLRVTPAIEARQAERIAKLRAWRCHDRVDAALIVVQKAAAGTANLLYPMKEALAAGATIGEVCDALRDVWGTYIPHDSY